MIVKAGSEKAKLHKSIFEFCNIFDPNYLKKNRLRKIISGLYFLYDSYDDLVYIGASSDIMKRIMQHEKKKDFEYYAYLEVDGKSDYMMIERLLIDRFKPKYNKDGLAKINRKKK